MRLAATLLLPVAVALSACGGIGVQADWEERPSHPALEPVLVEVPASKLRETCGDYPGMYLHGCARRDYEMRTCFIYTAPRPPAWLLEHERKHCAGYDHGTPRTFSH